jgi:hypothetical protein
MLTFSVATGPTAAPSTGDTNAAWPTTSPSKRTITTQAVSGTYRRACG